MPVAKPLCPPGRQQVGQAVVLQLQPVRPKATVVATLLLNQAQPWVADMSQERYLLLLGPLRQLGVCSMHKQAQVRLAAAGCV